MGNQDASQPVNNNIAVTIPCSECAQRRRDLGPTFEFVSCDPDDTRDGMCTFVIRVAAAQQGNS